jgi:protein-disulfide isomerase
MAVEGAMKIGRAVVTGRLFRGLSLALVAGVLWVSPAQTFAQSPPGAPSGGGAPSEFEQIKQDLEAIKGELRAIRELLQAEAPAAPPRVVAKVAIADGATLGKPDAPLTMIEFSDYQCPFCRRYVQTTLPALKQEYVETGKLRYVFRDFPLDRIHPNARKAAEAARCAGDQGKYWAMHDTLFGEPEALAVDDLKADAARLGLDAAAFAACLESGAHAASVQKGVDDGLSAGVQGTPSFFLGKTRPDGIVEGLMITGAQPLAEFRQEIERQAAGK